MRARGGILEAHGLTIAFGSGATATVAVDSASFTIARGEAFGLIGESGCGKSTVLRALAGLNSEYEGAILLADKEQPRRRDKAFFRKVQMVFKVPISLTKSLQKGCTVELIAWA